MGELEEKKESMEGVAAATEETNKKIDEAIKDAARKRQAEIPEYCETSKKLMDDYSAAVNEVAEAIDAVTPEMAENVKKAGKAIVDYSDFGLKGCPEEMLEAAKATLEAAEEVAEEAGNAVAKLEEEIKEAEAELEKAKEEQKDEDAMEEEKEEDDDDAE